MPQVSLSDAAFEEARLKAARGGYASVNEWMEDLIRGELTPDDLHQLFTPERLKLIDAAAEQIRSGKAFSDQEVDDRLGRLRAQRGAR